MSTNVGSVHYDLGLDTSRFDRAQASVSGKLSKLGGTLMHVAKRVAQAGAAMVVAGAVLGIKTASQLETARQGFITLLGSAEAADKTMNRIKKEAARTPFEVAGLTQATQMLASVTHDGDKAIDIILDVGEGLAAMGRGQAELDRISVNLQQIAATGRAAMIDIKQFAFAGIPIFEMLQQETGKSGDALEKFISEGGVTFDMLAKMFDRANDKGGRFFNAFRNQTGTFAQQWSNFKDTLSITAATIVTQIGLFDGLKNAMARMGAWIVNNRDAIVGTLTTIGRALIATWTFFKPRIEATREAMVRLWRFLSFSLGPVFKVLIQIIREQLLPVLREFWAQHGPMVQKMMKTIAVVIGGQLIVAIGIAVLAIAGLIKVISAIIRAINWWDRTVRSAARFIVDQVNRIINAFRRVEGGIRSALAGVSNAIIGPFKPAFDWIDSQTERIRSKLDRLNPWHRESPSLIDNIQSGTKQMVRDYGNFFNQISRMSAHTRPTLAGGIAGASASNVSTSIYGNINIGSQVDADIFMRRLTRNQELSMMGLSLT